MLVPQIDGKLTSCFATPAGAFVREHICYALGFVSEARCGFAQTCDSTQTRCRFAERRCGFTQTMYGVTQTTG